MRTFVELVERYINPEYVGYSTYSLQVMSEFLKKYFISPALEKQEQDRWIPVTERLPKCEQEVLICTKKKTYIHEKSGFEWCVNPIVTPAMYEDGTMLEVDSKWHWEDCDWAGWDEEEDCGIIPEGWWENRQFNPDGEYNHAIDVEVVAWRPLPEPYTEEES